MYSRSLLISPPFSSAWLRLRLITCSWDGTWRCWWPGGPWSLHDLLSKSWMSARKLSWLKDGPRGVQDINDITAFDWDTVKHPPISLQHIENNYNVVVNQCYDLLGFGWWLQVLKALFLVMHICTRNSRSGKKDCAEPFVAGPENESLGKRHATWLIGLG